MINRKQKQVCYEYEICVDGDVRWFYLGDEASVIRDAIEYKNSDAFLGETENYNVVEILKWTLDRNPASGGYGEEYHPEYFEIYPDFGSVNGGGYSDLKYENLPKYIQKKINIIRKSLA